MEVRPGNKKAKEGIREVWRNCDISDLCTLQRGFDLTEATRKPGTVPVYSSSGLSYFHNEAKLQPPAVITGRKGLLGKVFFVQEPCWPHDTTLWVKDYKGNDPRFVSVFLGQFKLERFDAATSVPTLNRNNLIGYPIQLPHPSEQRIIAAALSDVDALLVGLDRLSAKKRDLKHAVMQQLLTGKTRLPGFSGEWKVQRMADIASPSSEKNSSREKLPVLACSKHLGFMDSLSFFKNQIFSKDLSTYKVIRRNEIGYPANHVEEGSIGHQDLYNVALVSPIYVVFRVTEQINSFFLHRLLKLDSYRQKFKVATTSSVDRRGSLRWPAFSQITIGLPPTKDEQTAVVAALSDMEAELSALEARRDKTRALKQAMVQELLTGRTRLI